MVNYTEVVVSDFEQGGFYVGNYYDYDSSTEIRASIVTPFEETGTIRELTVNCAPYQWSFVCFNDSGTFVEISASLGYKDSGTIIDISSYNVSKVRIELHDANGITPPKSATLCVEYEYGTSSWHMEGTNPVPDNSPHFVQHGLRNPTGKTWFKVENNELKLGSISGRELGTNFYKPFARGMWQMNGLEPNAPYEPMMPGIMRHIPDPPPPPEPEAEEPVIVQYDIYCDDKLMHSSIVGEEAYKVIEPVLDLQDSAAGSLEFSLPPFNVMYNKMLMVASTIRVEKNGEEIWEGRPVSFKEDMWLNHNVTCEGELAYLNDVYQVQTKLENVTLTQLIWAVIGVNENGIDITKGYNQRAAANRRFDVGYVTAPKYETDTLTFVIPFDSTLNVINNICKEYGLHVYVEKHDGVRTLIFTGETVPRGENSTQKIVFGTNLVDYAKSYNFSSLVTAVLPLGAKSDKAGKTVIATNSQGLPIEITPTPYGTPELNGRGFVISPDDGSIVYIGSSGAPDANRYFVNQYTLTKDKATIFITAQNNNGFGMVCVKYNNTIYYLKKAKSGTPMTVWTQTKYPAWYDLFPEDATITVYIGGYDSVNDTGPTTGAAAYESKVVDEGMEDYTTVESVNYWYDSNNERHNDGYWVIDHDSNTIDIYGRIERKVEWNNVKDAQTLYNNAIQYLKSDQFDGMQVSLTALDMSLLGVKANNLRVGESVMVIAEPYGLAKQMPIQQIKIPLDKPEETKFTVGDKRQQNLTSVNSSTNSELLSMIAEKPSVSAVLTAAKRSAAEYITDTRNSYVTYRYGSNGETQAIIISDSEDYTQSQNGYWILGDHGIGYVRAGHSEATDYTDATVALTKDGKIVADYITTGTMLADRIRGGTLDLGYIALDGGGYLSGRMVIRDNHGQNIVRIGSPNDPDTEGRVDGVEIWPLTPAGESQASGSWMCIRDGHLYFGHATNNAVDDGLNWNTRPCIYGGSSVADVGYYSSISMFAPGYIIMQTQGLAWYDGNDVHLYDPGSHTYRAGNKNFHFHNGILEGVSDAGEGQTYPTAHFKVDNTTYYFQDGLLVRTETDTPEQSNE